MAKNNNLSDFLKDIADTLRNSLNLSDGDKINPQDFSTLISSLKTVNNQKTSITIDRNKIRTITPNTGYSGLSSVTVTVNVPVGNSYVTVHNVEQYSGPAGLKTVELTKDVTTIKTNAFKYSTNLKELIIPESVTTYESDSLSGPSNIDLTIYSQTIPDSFYETTKVNVKNLRLFRKQVTTENADGSFSSGVYYCKEIGAAAFRGNTSIETFIATQNTLQKWMIVSTERGGILAGAFKGCTNLTSIDISQSACSRIQENAFMDCTSLQGIFVAPSSLNVLERDVFYGCTNVSGYDFSKINGVVNADDFVAGYVWIHHHTLNKDLKYPWEYITTSQTLHSLGYTDHAPSGSDNKVIPHSSGFQLIIPKCYENDYKNHPIWGNYMIENTMYTTVDVDFGDGGDTENTPPPSGGGGTSGEVITTKIP